MDFDEWYLENSADAAMDVLRGAFEAGQQSKQAEIDSLKEKILKIIDSYATDSNSDDMGDEIKELLK